MTDQNRSFLQFTGPVLATALALTVDARKLGSSWEPTGTNTMAINDDDNAAALTLAFMESEPQLRAQLSRFLSRNEDIEDVLYEAYAKTYDAMQTQTIHAPKVFLLHVSRNLAINQLSKHSSRYEHTEDPYQLGEMYEHSDNTEAQLIALEKQQLLDSAIAMLPKQCRKAFLLRCKYQLSYKDIAKTMGISIKTVEKHLAEAIKKCAVVVRPQWQQNSTSERLEATATVASFQNPLRAANSDVQNLSVL